MFRSFFLLFLSFFWTQVAAVQNATAPKALSADEVQGYLEAKGMGMAKAAELNGYPGPAHVLELAGQLGLDEAQRKASQVLFESMRARASAAGSELIAKERELDRLFAAGRIDEVELAARLRDIGALQAQIRGIHLNAHLRQKALLTAEQVETYNRLRGYGPLPAAHRSHAH
jgi:Spy/CpxP family protein refolding chaperone